MLTDSIRKYLCKIVGLYDKNNNVLCFRSVPDSCKCFRAPVKIRGNGLAAGCQLFYCKIYRYFLQCNVEGTLCNVEGTFPFNETVQLELCFN